VDLAKLASRCSYPVLQCRRDSRNHDRTCAWKDLRRDVSKFGCDLDQCGACTMVVHRRAIRSCVTQFGAMKGAEITTLEGLGSIDRPHPLQQAFIDEQAAQCGFCLSGVILTAKARSTRIRTIRLPEETGSPNESS